jgi:hypothetical protein
MWKKLLRPLTYAAAAACGVCSFVFPVASPILIPAATALAGWATVHPSDAATPEALTELAKQAATIALQEAAKQRSK